jgi:hypothetical protein
MDKQEIIAWLRENEAALKARGAVHAAMFGSRARGPYCVPCRITP